MRKTIAKFLLVLTIFFSLTPAAMAISLGDRVLAVGSVGDDVAQLQQSLNTQGFWAGFVDGVFGELTKNALMEYQGANRINVDGVAGRETFQKLNINSSYRGYSSRFSARDIELLAKLVYAEARGESYSGQVAVAATVLNRLNDPKYPKSIPEIIFQVVDGYYQYSPVLDGQINLTPDETARRAVMML